MSIIQCLHSRQRLLKVGPWSEIYEHTDLSVYDDISMMQHKDYYTPAPELEIRNSEHEIIVTVETAWSDFEIAINVTPVEID
ncbi:hypothetical protein D5Q71_23710 [Escherichia coli]|nr:hypothetical protein [Escherichia coli]